MATVIVGVMLVAAMTTVEASLRMGNATAERSHASAFGALLMSEILRARYVRDAAVPIAVGPGRVCGGIHVGGNRSARGADA